MLPLTRSRNRSRFFGIPFSPAKLFAGGTVAGAWYDPSDLSTMFTTSAGTTPVAMPGLGAAVPVGAMLDKRASAYSVYFDGAGDFLTVGTTSTFNFMHNASALFTFECWVYRTVGSVDQVLFANVISSANVGAGVFISAANKLVVEIYRGVLSSFVIQHTSIATIPTNQWTHVAVTYNQSLASNNSSFYINGVLDSQATKTADAPSGSNASNAARIGILPGGTSLPFTGYISNLRIVNAVLPISLPTAPLTALTGTALLTCGTTWSGNPAITTAGNTRVDGLNPFTASPVGNHAIAFNNTTARPELRARVNLLTYSEEFDNGAWTKSGGSITATNISDPLGGVTADEFTISGGSTTHNVTYAPVTITSIGNATHRASFYAKKGTHSYLRVGRKTTDWPAPGTWWWNLDDGTFNGTLGTDWTNQSIVAVGNGWYLLSVDVKTISTPTALTIGPAVSLTDSSGNITFSSDGATIFIWGADLRPANIGANVPAYQRIADANTYDTSGFPLYLRFDGIDDSMYTPANLNLSGTDKVAVFAGVRQTTAGSQQLVEFSADTNTNNGAFSMPKDAVAAAVWTIGLRGTSATSASSPANYAAPITTVNAGLYDIALSTDEAKLRINGAQVATSGAGSAGAGNFGTYPLFIGARNNSSLWFNGHLHSLIIAGSAVSAGNISATEQWVAGKTGIQI